MKRYNDAGLLGSADAPGRGAKPPLYADQEKRFRARVEAGPTPADGVATLRGEDFRRRLEKEFGVVRSPGAVNYLRHRLGYSSLVPPAVVGRRPPAVPGDER